MMILIMEFVRDTQLGFLWELRSIRTASVDDEYGGTRNTNPWKSVSEQNTTNYFILIRAYTFRLWYTRYNATKLIIFASSKYTDTGPDYNTYLAPIMRQNHPLEGPGVYFLKVHEIELPFVLKHDLLVQSSLRKWARSLDIPSTVRHPIMHRSSHVASVKGKSRASRQCGPLENFWFGDREIPHNSPFPPLKIWKPPKEIWKIFNGIWLVYLKSFLINLYYK